jgi:hypothetical protein
MFQSGELTDEMIQNALGNDPDDEDDDD